MRRRIAFTAALVVALAGMGSGVARATQTTPRGAFTPPKVQKAFYDDHLDAFVSTDTSSKFFAKAMGINFSPVLASLKPKAFPEIYVVKGRAAQGQLTVLGSEPGESNYSPIWNRVTVTWKQSATPVLLTSDTQIDDRESAGDLTTTRTKLLFDCPVIAEDIDAGAHVAPPTVFKTFYDAHRDGMLATDVGSKTQAKAKHINFSPVLANLGSKAFPEIYIFQGRMAKGQLMVLGSEPGEPDYSPVWGETFAHWKAGVTPHVVKSDTAVDHLAATGKIVLQDTTLLLNCPVTGEAGQ
ncbi:MAG: hypothetical protein M3Q23_12405 [Actinomycetota bacterium]|nr:hypothetical protein [Actinomycetota bacterium]